MQCLSAQVAELERKLVVQPICTMSESILTASYRNTSISDSERQSIINAAVAAVDSSKPRYKDIAISFTVRLSQAPKGGYNEVTYYHGMKTIQTAMVMMTTDLEWRGNSSWNTTSITAGYEKAASTAFSKLYSYSGHGDVGVYYNSSYVVVRYNNYHSGSGNTAVEYRGNGILRFYGTY